MHRLWNPPSFLKHLYVYMYGICFNVCGPSFHNIKKASVFQSPVSKELLVPCTMASFHLKWPPYVFYRQNLTLSQLLEVTFAVNLWQSTRKGPPVYE